MYISDWEKVPRTDLMTNSRADVVAYTDQIYASGRGRDVYELEAPCDSDPE